ncbi:MAG TPA: hypothetical protein VFQ77_08700 [Pseudonocardiaceae bacterium]|jgi:hypothetical protein|nr:hypothetical protein [Pseudonocardiaceae bacterium]
MDHELKLSLEQEQSPELSSPVFDLERMETEQVADLIAAIGMAIDAKIVAERWTENDESRDGQFDGLIMLIGKDLQNLPTRNLQKAMELYKTLINYPGTWPRELAADFMGAVLLQQLDDANARQQVIEPWLNLLDHESEFVREAAQRSIADIINVDWIDEPTVRYLESKLPEWYKEDW